jgi:RIO kinase 1
VSWAAGLESPARAALAQEDRAVDVESTDSPFDPRRKCRRLPRALPLVLLPEKREMKPIDSDSDPDPDFDLELTRPRRSAAPRRKWPTRAEKARAAELMAVETPDAGGFSPSLNARKAESLWLRRELGPFHQREVIADVVERIRAGKEATVYICTTPAGHARERVAAKVYHPSSRRTAANKQLYQLGRDVLDSDGRPVLARDWRMQKAIAKSSGAGKEATQASWLQHEYARLEQMHRAGGDVPEPLMHGGHVLLMEFVGDAAGAAPILANVALQPEEAKLVLDRILWNVELLLSFGWVHGDLSAHNILYQHGKPTLIDFPQVVAAEQNPRAFALLVRDLERVSSYFTRFGLSPSPLRLAEELWAKHVLPSTPDLAGPHD